MIKILYISVFATFSLFSCNNKEDVAKIQELQIQLIATEAQLLNVRSELSQCSSERDSIAQLQDKNWTKDTLAIVRD